MGFGTIIAQTIFVVSFLVLMVSALTLFSKSSKITVDAMESQSKRMLEISNTDYDILNVSYQPGLLSIRLQNNGGTPIDPNIMDIYINGTRVPRQNLSLASCTPIVAANRCGEIGYSDYSWEASNLVALWHFNEESWNGTNGEVQDNTSNANDGTATGANTTIGKFSRAASLAGSDSIDVGNASSLEVANAMTMAAWIKTSATTGGVIVRGMHNNPDGYGLVISNGKIQLISRDGAGTIHANIIGNTQIDDNRWHHVAVTYDGATGKVFVDGEQDATDTGSLVATSQNMLIGRHGAAYFNGSIDEAAVWSQPLAADDIRNLYRKGYQLSNPTLWDPAEYAEADIPFSLGTGTSLIEVMTHNGQRRTTILTT